MDAEIPFGVTAIYGRLTREPYVNIEFGATQGQVTPNHAREIAMMLLEAAEAAEADACLVQIFAEMNMPEESVHLLLHAIRLKRGELASATAAPDPEP